MDWTEICRQVNGMALLPALIALHELGLASGRGLPVSGHDHVRPGPLYVVCSALELAGWMKRQGDSDLQATFLWTRLGERMKRTEDWPRWSGGWEVPLEGNALAHVYAYPHAYRSLLSQLVPRLRGQWPMQRLDQGVDRKLDVQVSGKVARGLEPALREQLRHLPRPPKTIVDLGCGDGSVLRMLASAFEEPPRLVGIDLSPAALESASEQLQGLSHELLRGDIASPELPDSVVPEETLFCVKSVLHDRTYKPPREVLPALGDKGGLDLEDSWLAPELVEASLTELFRAWAPYWNASLGTLLAEAHALPRSQISACREHSLNPMLELTHGLSCQYLLEPEVFSACLKRAGLQSLRRQTFGEDVCRHVTLTLEMLKGSA